MSCFPICSVDAAYGRYHAIVLLRSQSFGIKQTLGIKEIINTCLQFSTIQALTGCMDRETKVQQMVAANSLCLRKLFLFLEKRTA